MTEQLNNVPSAEEQIAQNGIIDQVPGVEATQIPVQSQGGEESIEVKHGGYATGIRVGEMGKRIANLQLAGKWAEAQALTDQLEKVSPAK